MEQTHEHIVHEATARECEQELRQWVKTKLELLTRQLETESLTSTELKRSHAEIAPTVLEGVL